MRTAIFFAIMQHVVVILYRLFVKNYQFRLHGSGILPGFCVFNIYVPHTYVDSLLEWAFVDSIRSRHS